MAQGDPELMVIGPKVPLERPGGGKVPLCLIGLIIGLICMTYKGIGASDV